MPIYSGGGGVGGITVEEDPSALKMAQNLADLQDVPTARTNLGVYSTTEVYSTGETNTAISNALSSYTPPTPNFPYIVLDDNTSSTTPYASGIKMGTIVCAATTTSMSIYLDASLGYTVGDKFAIATTGWSNVTVYGVNSPNWPYYYNNINGNTSHQINQATVHWATYCASLENDGTVNYYWAIG